MAKNYRKIFTGIQLVGQNATSPDLAGELRYNSSSNKLEIYDSTVRSLVTNTGTETLTNKTFDADNNTLTNISNSQIKTGANIDRNKLASGTAYRLLVNDASGVLTDNGALTAGHVLYTDSNGLPTGEATLSPTRGGTGVNNNAAATLTRSGNHDLTLTTSAPTSLTLPTSGTLATLAGTESFSNKTFSDAVIHNHVVTPSNPSVGKAKFYIKNDNKAYILDSAGNEVELGIAGPQVIPTGARTGYVGATAPSGWVMASGNTIGSATSGATERANADTLALFSLLWNSYSNTELPIQDSSGTPTTRGIDAATDFAADKRMPLPDYRGRVGVGKDDMGGIAANRITNANSGIDGTIIGKNGGLETIAQHNHGVGTLATGTQSASHTHGPGSLATGNESIDHYHLFGEAFTGENNASHPRVQTTGNTIATSGQNTSHTHAVTSGATGTESANHTHTISGSTASTGTGISGSGHGNVQPSIMENVIIKL